MSLSSVDIYGKSHVRYTRTLVSVRTCNEIGNGGFILLVTLVEIAWPVGKTRLANFYFRSAVFF